MKELAVGDRVAIYGMYGRSTGTVVGVAGDKVHYHLGANATLTHVAHRKQVRKLVKKERRRVWVQYATATHPYISTYHSDPPEGAVEFVEVRKPKGENNG